MQILRNAFVYPTFSYSQPFHDSLPPQGRNMAKLAKIFGEVSQAHTKRAMVVGRLLRIRRLVAPASDQPSQSVDGSGLFVRMWAQVGVCP